MKYSVTFYTDVDRYDWASPQHHVAESPQDAAIADRKYIFDECLGLENYEIFDKCYNNDEPDCTELLVLCEDGKSWLVTVESSPTTYDVRREKLIVWDHVVVSCEPADVKFRWHEYVEADRDDVDLFDHELPYGAVHHICTKDHCANCAELDVTIATRAQSKELPKS